MTLDAVADPPDHAYDPLCMNAIPILPYITSFSTIPDSILLNSSAHKYSRPILSDYGQLLEHRASKEQDNHIPLPFPRQPLLASRRPSVSVSTGTYLVCPSTTPQPLYIKITAHRARTDRNKIPRLKTHTTQISSAQAPCLGETTPNPIAPQMARRKRMHTSIAQNHATQRHRTPSAS